MKDNTKHVGVETVRFAVINRDDSAGITGHMKLDCEFRHGDSIVFMLTRLQARSIKDFLVHFLEQQWPEEDQPRQPKKPQKKPPPTLTE